MSSLKSRTVALLLVLTIAVAGAVTLTYRLVAEQPQKDKKEQVGKPPAEWTKIRREMLDAARSQYQGRWEEYQAGKTTADFLMTATAYLLDAQLSLAENKGERLAAHRAYLEQLRAAEAFAKAKYDAGSIAKTQYSQILFYRTQAELWLAQVRASEDGRKGVERCACSH